MFILRYRIRCDYRRLNRHWRECRRLSAPFANLDRSVRHSGDKDILPLMGDCADECGFPILARVLRTGLRVVGKPTRKRRRRRV